ncbi:hypothetical protein MNBD_PLANCTO02-1685, partial [hydrothermal vent metagenome]
MTKATIPITSQDSLRILLGARDEFLRQVRDSVGVNIVVRGDELRLQGEEENVKRGIDILTRLQTIIEQTGALYENQVYQILDSKENPSETETEQKTEEVSSDKPDNPVVENSESVLEEPVSEEATSQEQTKKETEENSSNGQEQKPEFVIDLFEKGRKIM